MKLNWKTRSTKYILQDKWISLRADSCIMPDGKIIEPYYVLEYPDWINIVPLTPDNEVIFTKQYRHGIKQTILEIPCGAIEPSDRSPADAAKRELLEETGYSSDDLIELCKLSPNPANHTNTTHCFLARNAIKNSKQALDPTEQIEIQKIPLPEVMSLLKSNQIPQTLHVSALFYALEYLKEMQL